MKSRLTRLACPGRRPRRRLQVALTSLREEHLGMKARLSRLVYSLAALAALAAVLEAGMKWH